MGALFLLLPRERKKPLVFFLLAMVATLGSHEITELLVASVLEQEEVRANWVSSSITSELSTLRPSNCENEKSDSWNRCKMLDKLSPSHTMWSTCNFIYNTIVFLWVTTLIFTFQKIMKYSTNTITS